LRGEELSYAEFLRLMFDSQTLARVAHFLVASVAVTGVLILGFALRIARRGQSEDAGRVTAWGARLALAASLLQILTGMYVLLELPDPQRNRLLGSSWLATGLFAASLLAVLALLHHLAELSLTPSSRRAERDGDLPARPQILRTMALMGLVVLLMVAARHASRPPQAAKSLSWTATTAWSIAPR
jgi:putative copper export protein